MPTIVCPPISNAVPAAPLKRTMEATAVVRPTVATSSAPAEEATTTTGTIVPTARTFRASASSPIDLASSSLSAPSSSSSPDWSASSQSPNPPAGWTHTTTPSTPGCPPPSRPSLAQHRTPAAQRAHRRDRPPPHLPLHRRHGGVVWPGPSHHPPRPALAARNPRPRIRSSWPANGSPGTNSRYRESPFVPAAAADTPSTSSPAPTPSILPRASSDSSPPPSASSPSAASKTVRSWLTAPPGTGTPSPPSGSASSP